MSWRKLGAYIQPPPPVTAVPLQLIQGKVRQNLHNKHLNCFRTIHTSTSSSIGSKTEGKDGSSYRIHDLALQLSQRPMNGNSVMKYTLYDSSGTAAPVNQLTKLEVAERYGLSTRDLRVFDLPTSGFPYILVRGSTILIHLFDLRLLVRDDQTLVFYIIENPDRQRPYEDSQTVSHVFTHNLEEKLRAGHGLGFSLKQPYELRVVETALASVTSVFEAEYLSTKHQVSNVLEMADLDALGKEENLIHTKLRMTLELTRKLSGIEKRARQVRNVVQEVLNEDEDMANMYLTDKKAGRPHEVQDHQDVEYLFEAYFKASDAIVQEAVGLIGNIRRTEETIHSTLTVRRNQIMVLEAKIEIIMLAMAGATLVAGWYGMNVINYFEESAYAFAGLLAVSLTAVALTSWYGMRKLRYIHKLRL